jgi:chromosome segregation ATPase
MAVCFHIPVSPDRAGDLRRRAGGDAVTPEQIISFGGLVLAIILQGITQWRKVNALSQQQTQNVANIAQSKSDIEVVRADLDRERELRQQLERERDDLKHEVRALKDRLEAVITTGTRQADQLLAVQLENASLKGRLEEQHNIYPKQIKDLQVQVNDLQSALMTSTSREGDLSSQLLTTQASLIAARGEVDTLKDQVSELESKVRQLQAEKMARVLNAAAAQSKKQPVATPAPKPAPAKKQRKKAMASA